MLKRHATIWLALCLLPYLAFALIGNLPHQHGYDGHAATCSHVLPTNGSSPVITAVEAGDAHCPVCEVQAAFGTCASLTFVPVVLPVRSTPRISITRALTLRHLSASTASRAPPASLS